MSNIREQIELLEEQIFDTWTLNCIPMNQGKYLGKLFVTDQTLYFDTQFDVTFKNLLSDIITAFTTGNNHALLVSKEIIEQWENKGFITIPKNKIKEVITKSSFLKKKVIVILKDDNEFVFDYGMLSVTKIAEAIKQ